MTEKILRLLLPVHNKNMFTGIVEATGIIKSITVKGTNRIIEVTCPFTAELKPDQSISHNGVCLTVTEIRNESYLATVVDETLKRSNLSLLEKGDIINLERCLRVDGRFDGHIVQGHVDCIASCKSITDKNGSFIFEFEYSDNTNITVEKGSVCVNGVSLTVVESHKNIFTVAIIPYTHEHTNFHLLKRGSTVNVEFDIIGKYVQRILKEKV